MSNDSLREEDATLLHWLRTNGAHIDKVLWPAATTVDGIRGAVARADIASGESMFEIPERLMMTPLHAIASPEIGEMLQREKGTLVGDLTLVVFIMHERSKSAASFWWPFLRTLPKPSTIIDWSGAELQELQHDQLATRARARAHRLRTVHDRIFVNRLAILYPELFPFAEGPEDTAEGNQLKEGKAPVPTLWWSLEAFAFAWGTVQARAFGRRLPWTALVPFADLLNHTNVQTKYEFAATEMIASSPSSGSGSGGEKDEEARQSANTAAAATATAEEEEEVEEDRRAADGEENDSGGGGGGGASAGGAQKDPKENTEEEERRRRFRLFPSGRNGYAQGAEVFNSYGRRPNDNLLLEYGFALVDNEWEALDLNPLPHKDAGTANKPKPEVPVTTPTTPTTMTAPAITVPTAPAVPTTTTVATTTTAEPAPLTKAANLADAVSVTLDDPAWPQRRRLLLHHGVSLLRPFKLFQQGKGAEWGASGARALLVLQRVLKLDATQVSTALLSSSHAPLAQGAGVGSLVPAVSSLPPLAARSRRPSSVRWEGESSDQSPSSSTAVSAAAAAATNLAKKQGNAVEAAVEETPPAPLVAVADSVPPSPPPPPNAPPPPSFTTGGAQRTVQRIHTPPPTLPAQRTHGPPHRSYGDGGDGDDGGGSDDGGDDDWSGLPPLALPTSVESERAALAGCASRLEGWLGEQPTTLAHDEALLEMMSRPPGPSSSLSADSNYVNNDKLLNAVRYRVTRKRIARDFLSDLAVLFKELNRIALSQPSQHAASGDDLAAPAKKKEVCGVGSGGGGGVLEALAALGLAPPPVPQLSAFPAHLRDAVSMMRFALGNDKR